MRYAVVVIAICSWFAVSNHCAFAAVAAGGTGCQPVSHDRQDADATECPFHSKPAKQKEQSTQIQCCKILRAIVLEETKSWARDDAKFSNLDLWVESFVPFGQPHAGVPLLLDTGPPVAFSFAELTLQRSLLAHAPPVLV
jgi:hypothetical protein